MSDTILGGDFTVYYLTENRQKRLEWTGSATGTRTMNELYSACQDLFDDLNQLDDGVPISAQTPTEYTVGIIDPSDDDPWFIDRTSVEHLTGGSLKTNGWDRVDGTNTGIIKMGYAETVALVAGDIGKDIVMTTDGDTGTLLDFNSTTNELWIRPDTNAAANSFDNSPTTNGAWTITGGTGTGTQSGGAATSAGESLWPNIFSLGTLYQGDDTHLYVYQNGSAVTKYKDSTSDWWPDGHLDVLIPVQILDSTPIDEGYLTVFGRRYSQSYTNFITDVSAGGRNPVPLQTGNDSDNATGYRQFTGSSGSGTFNVGNYIYDSTAAATWATTTKKGVITAVGGTGAAPVISYYLIGDQTDFANTDPIQEYDPSTGADGDASCTAGTPSNIGPAADSTTTITHANNDVDVTEDGTAEPYSITIDLGGTVSVADAYEFTKYETRRGSTTTDTTDGIEGEQYIGSDWRISYVTLTGTVSEGAVVTQVTSGATGTVVAHHTDDKILVLRNSRGTFNNSNNIEVDGSNYVATPTSTSISPITAAPFGTFAGGTWFCAPGVVLTNVPTADANNYQLIDDTGVTRQAPTKVEVKVDNTRALDTIAVFRLTGSGGTIDKAKYAGTVQSAGATTVVVGTAIATDEPGKSTGGVVRVVDVDNDVEYRLRFSSWASSTFTLASTSSDTTEAGGNGTSTTKITATGAFTNSQVGDLIRNQTRSNAVSYISQIVDNNEVNIDPPITGQTSGDTFDINVLPFATDTNDDVYVPIIDVHETTGTDGSPGSETVNITFDSTVYVLVRGRQGGDILPFEATSSITSSGMTVAVIRTPDSIYT